MIKFFAFNSATRSLINEGSMKVRCFLSFSHTDDDDDDNNVKGTQCFPNSRALFGGGFRNYLALLGIISKRQEGISCCCCGGE